MRFPLVLSLCVGLVAAAAATSFAVTAVAEPRVAVPVGRTLVHYTDPERRDWDGAGPRPLDTVVWYPARADVLPARWQVGPFEAGTSVAGAPMADTASKLPLIVVSHGTGGSAASIAWLAEALAAGGYLVAVVHHHGNTGAEPRARIEGAVVWWDRPRDLTVLIDRLLADPRFGPRVDPQRIGVAGFSIGGYTALATVGARLDFGQWQRFCATHPADSTCNLPPESNGTADDLVRLLGSDVRIKRAIAEAGADFTDPRVRAAFVIAPAVGPVVTAASLARIDRPVHFVVGSKDTMTPPELNALPLSRAIAGATLQVLPDVTHYTFLSSCRTLATWWVGAPCRDEAGVVRADVHRTVGDDALRFFAQHLVPTVSERP